MSNFYKKNKVDYRIYHPKHKLLQMSMHKQKRNDDAYFRIVYHNNYARILHVKILTFVYTEHPFLDNDAENPHG